MTDGQNASSAYPRARPPREGRPHELGPRDDDLPAPGFEKLDCSLYLRAHAPRRKMPFGKVAFHFRESHPVEALLACGAIVQIDPVYLGQDDDALGPDLPREGGGRKILVDHGVDAP